MPFCQVVSCFAFNLPYTFPENNMKEKKSLGPNPYLYPEPTFLVATYGPGGKPNAMTVAWGGICSSDPLSLAVSIRSACWTHAAMKERKAFTVNIPSVSMVAQMDYAGMASGKNIDKFEILKWTALKAEKVDAPYISECPIILECSLSQIVELGLHTMFIGAILDVKADLDCLEPGGKYPDIAKISPIIFDSGSRNYYGLGERIGKGWHSGKEIDK